MNNWILYDELVDLVRNHHRNGFSGLVSGVSEAAHSFQIGFDRGTIVLLTYRVNKGAAALQLLTRVERARIAEQANREFPLLDGEVPNTGAILSQLTSHSLAEASSTTDFSELPAPRQEARAASSAAGASLAKLSPKLRQAIETAAVHYFGPIGAIVCEEHLDDSSGDLRRIILDIAHDVGASEADTRAFLQSVVSD